MSTCHDSLGQNDKRSTRVHDQGELPAVNKGGDEAREKDGQVKDNQHQFLSDSFLDSIEISRIDKRFDNMQIIWKGFYSLCHFYGKVLVFYRIIPRHVLSNHSIKEGLSDLRNLLESRVVGQVNGDKGEYKVDY